MPLANNCRRRRERRVCQERRSSSAHKASCKRVLTFCKKDRLSAGIPCSSKTTSNCASSSFSSFFPPWEAAVLPRSPAAASGLLPSFPGATVVAQPLFPLGFTPSPAVITASEKQPHDSRKTGFVGTTIFGGTSRPSKSARSVSTANQPCSYKGWLTVVRVGEE